MTYLEGINHTNSILLMDLSRNIRWSLFACWKSSFFSSFIYLCNKSTIWQMFLGFCSLISYRRTLKIIKVGFKYAEKGGRPNISMLLLSISEMCSPFANNLLSYSFINSWFSTIRYFFKPLPYSSSEKSSSPASNYLIFIHFSMTVNTSSTVILPLMIS